VRPRRTTKSGQDHFSAEEIQMFDTLRNTRMKTAASSAGIVVIATMIGAGVSVADTKGKLTEVSLQNTLPITVEVTFSGDETLKKISPYQTAGNGPARVIGKVADGITIKWEAKPKNDQDKNKYIGCKGEKKVSGATTTIVMSADNCGKANAAPKADTTNNQANSKPSEKSPDAKAASDKAAKDKAAKDKTDNEKTANNKTSGNSADSAGGTLQITFQNTMDNQAVSSMRIWDLAVPGSSSLDISSIGAATLDGKPSGFKNTINFTAKKDKGGKYNIEVELHCDKYGNTAKYKDAVTTIPIVKSSDGGCELKNVKKQ